MARSSALLERQGSGVTALAAEAYDILKLAVPIFIQSVSWVAMKVTDTALLGHAGTQYLTASSLSDLWTSSTGVFIMPRTVGMFCSQAYGAGNKPLVGIWLQVAYFVLSMVCVFVAIAWSLTGVVLRAFGKSETLASNAQYYALVLMLCLPARIGFSQLSSFFASQRILRPGVICATCGMLFNLAFGLFFVLGVPVPGWGGFGFSACPWVTTALEYFQLALLVYVFCHRKQLHAECWPGWSRQHITRQRLSKFLGQWGPAALSSGSDFWRVAVIGAVASTLGDVDVAVWNASYRICWITLTFLGSIARAMSIKLGQDLGRGESGNAKRIALLGTGIAFVIALLLAAIVACIPRHCGLIFSHDPVILDIFEEVRWPMAAFVLTMNFGTMLEQVPMAVGMANTVFYAGLCGSWLGQVPAVFLCTQVLWKKDLAGLYTGVALGYGLLILLLGAATLTINWEQAAAEALARSEAARAARSSSASFRDDQESQSKSESS